MLLKIVACEVMKEELLAASNGNEVEIEFIPMGFHLYPEKLKTELQRILDNSKGYSRIVLAFGLCGGAAKDLRALDFTLTIPRVHDCIPLFLGSVKRFEEFRLDEKGTFYLSCGWLYGEKSILKEFKHNCERFGEKKAKSILNRMYDSYRKILFIHTGDSREKECIEQSQEIAQLLNLDFQTTQGGASYLEKIVNGPWDDKDFVNIPPNGIIDEQEFLLSGCNKGKN